MAKVSPAFWIFTILVVLVGLNILINPPRALTAFAVQSVPSDQLKGPSLSPSRDTLTGQVISVPGSLGATVSNTPGCCTRFCQQSLQNECPFAGEFVENKDCASLDQCNIGCCMDNDYYCFTNYLKGNCARNDFTFVRNMCNEIYDCVVPHKETPYTCYSGFGLVNAMNPYDCRQINLPSAFVRVLPPTGKAGTVFTVGYYVQHDISTVRRVHLVLKNKDDVTLGQLDLYDDGAHNDGQPDDGYFVNVWDSSRVPDGIHKVSVDATIARSSGAPEKNTFADVFVVVGGAQCVPLDTYPNVDFANTKNIAFVGRAFPSDYPTSFGNVVAHAAYLISAMQRNTGTAAPLTFHKIDTPLVGAVPVIRTKTQKECSVMKDTDTIILFDPAEDGCVKDGSVIRVNPQFTFDTTAEPVDIFDGDNFCTHVLTPQRLMSRIIAENTPAVFSFAPAQGELIPDTRQIPYTVVDNLDTQLSVSFLLNYEELPSLSARVSANEPHAVLLPCLRSGQVSILTGEVVDNDDNYASQEVTIEVPVGGGFNEENCPPGVPIDVWYANRESPPSAGATYGSPFDPARMAACAETLDADPMCCYNRGTWTPHTEEASTYYTCEDVPCTEDDPPCPADRFCTGGFCR